MGVFRAMDLLPQYLRERVLEGLNYNVLQFYEDGGGRVGGWNYLLEFEIRIGLRRCAPQPTQLPTILNQQRCLECLMLEMFQTIRLRPRRSVHRFFTV